MNQGLTRVKKEKPFLKPLMKTKIELRKSKHINFFMKRLMLFSGLFLIASISSKVFAENGGHYQQAPKDSIPKKIIGKVKITVKDLMDGSAVDSVYVTAGIKRGYTDSKGVVELDSVPAGTMVNASKAGYLAQSKKVKADLQIRIGRREMQTSANNYKNGLFERPLEHFSGAATIVSGNDLRKINP
jgi:hypothetical protein